MPLDNEKHTEKSPTLQEISDQLHVSIYWKDRDGRYIGCNDYAASMVNMLANELIGKTDYDIFPHETAASYELNDKKVMSDKKASCFEEVEKSSDGKIITHLSSKAPLLDGNGNVYGIIGHTMDISYIKEIEARLWAAKEQAELANQTKSRLITMLGHELKMPLMTILSLAQKLEEMPVLGKKRELPETIIQEGVALLNVTTEIVNFTEGNLESQRLHKPTLFDLKQLLEDTVASYQDFVQQRKIFLILEYPSGAPNWIKSDKLAWRRVINYLLSYSIQTSKRDQLTIDIKSIKQGSKLLELELTIESRGAAINEVQTLVDTIQEKSTSEIQSAPLLLGLDNMKQLILQLGGHLLVEYHTTSGIKCLCRFAVEYDKNPPVINYPWTVHQEKVRILIVDNSPRGTVIQQHLGHHNIDLMGTTDDVFTILRAALILKKPYHIVLVGGVHRGEVQQPRAMRLAKDIKNEKSVIPSPMLLLLSEEDSIALREQADKAGYYDLINPLIGPMALQTELTTIWEKWRETEDDKSE